MFEAEIGFADEWGYLEKERWESRGSHGENRRGEVRLVLPIEIKVSGFTPEGAYFTENSTTVNISERGCCFRLKTQLQKRSVVAIRLNSEAMRVDEPTPHAIYHIAWLKPDGDGWLLGAYQINQENIWKIAFPA